MVSVWVIRFILAYLIYFNVICRWGSLDGFNDIGRTLRKRLFDTSQSDHLLHDVGDDGFMVILQHYDQRQILSGVDFEDE